MTTDATFELWALGAVALWTLVAPPRLASTLHRAILRGCARLGRRPRAWILVSGLGAAAVAAAGARFVLWPEPRIHDEFSYLLAADLFAGGRVSMPTHPMWEHLETFHVLHQPSYASKYPPAQGLALAVGVALFNTAAVGLWLQAGAMCAALAWMLLGWLPARWAVVGSMVALSRFGVAGPWVQTFYGGAVAATGGALVLGAVPRILRRRRTSDALLLGLGLAVLASSRPFEGLVASLPAALVLGTFALRGLRRGEPLLLRRFLLPLAAVLATTAAAMAYYNDGVTGDPLRMPYTVYDEQYAVYPPFLAQGTYPTPELRHEIMEEFMLGFQAGDHDAVRDLARLPGLALERILDLGAFFCGLLLLLPLGALVSRLRRPEPGVGLAAVTCALVVAGLLTTTYLQPHYAAPATGAFVLVVAAGWRALARSPLLPRRRLHALSSGLALALLALAAQRVLDGELTPPYRFGQVRAQFRDALLERKGRDLVIVRYEDGHSPHHEWVFNDAVVDQSPIVWARDMGVERNRRLIEYFEDRRVWSLVSGKALDGGNRLRPYGREERGK